MQKHRDPVYRVMVSSTALDLPRHREELRGACERLSLLPRMMEQMPAQDEEAVAASLALVDEADVYLGLFAFRYGHVPDGDDRSITEIEYDRAVERGIPRICFLMHEDHDVKPGDVETGPGAERIAALRKRVGEERVVELFRSPDDLRAHAIHALGTVKRRLDEAAEEEEGKPSAVAAARAFHYVAPLPDPPEPYVAHPYTLLQTRRLIGRREELNRLTDWVAGSEAAGGPRLLCLEALGGVGKSALAWHWFDRIAPQEMEPLAGRLWWSFYESGMKSLEDLTPAIELFHTLVGLGRFEEALRLFRDRVSKATLWRLSAARQRAEMLERFFPEGIECPPRLDSARDRSWVLNGLAQAYQFNGQPGVAADLFLRAAEMDRREEDL